MGSINVPVLYGEDPERWVEWFKAFTQNFTVFKTRQLAYGFIKGDAPSCYGDEISGYGFSNWDELKVRLLNRFSTSVKQEKDQLEQPSLMDSLKEMSQLLNRFEQRWKGKEDTTKSQEEKIFDSDDTKQVESVDGGDDLIMYSNQLVRYVKIDTLFLDYPVMMQEKDDSETETFLFEEDNSSKTEMDSGAYQVFEKILKRKKKIIKKKKRLKRHFSDIKDRLAEILKHKESDNSDMLGIQMENTTKRQRKSWLEWSKGSCHWVHTRKKLGRKWMLLIFREKNMCDEFMNLRAHQKELADLYSKIPTMYRHEINRITAQICIGRGRIFVNCETRFAKLTMVGKDKYIVTMDVHRKVLLERSRFFMEKMCCRREKGVSHMVEINECDDVEIETVVLMYYDDLKKKLVGENVIKLLALLKVSAALSFDEVMSEHLEAASWLEDEEDIVLSCLDELHLPEDSVTVILHKVSSEPKRAKADDIFLKLLTDDLQGKDEKAWREMKFLIFKLFREETDHEVSKDTLYLLCHRCLVSLVLCLSEATTQINNLRKDRVVLIGEIAREADNMLWMVDKLTKKKYNNDIRKVHKALGKLRRECERANQTLSNQHQVRVEIESRHDTKMTSKKAMDYLALTLKKVATDCSQAKERPAFVKTKLEAARLDSKEWKQKHEEARKEAELFENMSERLRTEAEESLLDWNGKEYVKRGEDEKSLLLNENNRLFVALVATENLSKKAKDENMKDRDTLKPVISEANVDAEVVARDENLNLRDTLLDKEEELQFALKEVERVKINEAVASDYIKKLKKLLSEVEVAMEEDKHRSLSRQESMQKEVEVKVLRILSTEVETFEFGEVEVTEAAVCRNECPLVDLLHLMNQKVRGFSWVNVLSPRHVGCFWILDVMDKGSSSFMCFQWIQKLHSSLSTRTSCLLCLTMTIQVACYCDLSVDARDHTFNIIVDILVGRLVCSKELSMYNGKLQLVQAKKIIRMVFPVQSIRTHRASVEQMDVMVVCIHSPTFGVAQYGNNRVAPDFTIHSVHAMEFIDSKDGFGNKEAISVAGDLKVLLNGSKAVENFDIEDVSRIPRIDGKFRDAVKSVHSDDEEHVKKKRRRRTWTDLQEQETVVFYSCELEFMVSMKALERLKFKEMRGLLILKICRKWDSSLRGRMLD